MVSGCGKCFVALHPRACSEHESKYLGAYPAGAFTTIQSKSKDNLRAM